MKTYRFILFLAFGVQIFSCSKDYSQVDKLSEQNLRLDKTTVPVDFQNLSTSPSFFSEYYYNGLGLELGDMELTGRLHNEYALELTNLMDLSCTNCLNEFNHVLTTLLKLEFETLNVESGEEIAEVIIDESLLDALELKNIDYDFTTWENNHMSTKFNEEYQKIIDLVYSVASISELGIELDYFITQVSQSSFSIFEKEMLITSSEIARNSFKLWAPTSMKGLGFLDLINNKENSSSSSNSRWCWRCAAAGDVAGLATYFMTIGIAGSITAAAIPGTNVALAAGAAGAAAGGSVTAGSGITNP